MITLNGAAINESNSSEVASQLLESGEPWKQDIASFLLNWYSPEDFIVANTSGSTGTPKQIQLKKSTMVASAKATCECFNLNASSTALLCLPSTFIAGKMMIVRALVGGFKLKCTEPSSNPLPSSIKEIDFAAMVPMQVENSLQQSPRAFLQIKKLIIGGASPSQSLINQLSTIPNEYTVTYGMTETATHVAISDLSSEESGVFKAIGETTFEVDERSCLIVNAPHMEIAPVVTNDVVKLLSSSSFQLKGRFDNAINTGGVKVHPEEIEKKIESIIDTRFFITGQQDGSLGEVVTLVLEGGRRTTEDWKLDELLNKFETPRRFFYVDQFEETGSGKIDRIATLRLIG